MQEHLPPDEIIRRAIQASASRLRKQHELAVRFAVFALDENANVAQIIKEASCIAANGVGSRYAKVLRYVRGQCNFVLEAGVGWNDEDIGAVTLGSDDASPAGFAFSSGKPVISNHLGDEHRFRTPAILMKYGIERAINVPIRGVGVGYGVLEADSTDGDDFIESDIVFMEAVSNVISMALEREAALAARQRNQHFSFAVLNASPDCITVLTNVGELQFMNENGKRLMEIDHFQSFVNQPYELLWPEPEREHIGQAIRRAAKGSSTRFEAWCTTMKGEKRWWDVSIAPIGGHSERTEGIICVSRDITERHVHEEDLTRFATDRENEANSSNLMMKEVHHRVRNSLQLVQTLLYLQGTLAGDSTVKSQLDIAAQRVMTVASVHERLYRDNGAEATDASGYVGGLLEDLNRAFCDRKIRLDAPPVTLDAKRLAPLGLVVCELVTNALKYGKGDVLVTLETSEDLLLVTVSDEGIGFPDTFPKPQGTGLGMRLVSSFAGFGAESVEVDRSAGHSKIKVRFKH